MRVVVYWWCWRIEKGIFEGSLSFVSERERHIKWFRVRYVLSISGRYLKQPKRGNGDLIR